MTSERCPSCAAAVPAGASWCGQCYADLRPSPPAPPPAPAPSPAGVAAGVPATLVAEAPATEAPATEAPATEAPATEAAPSAVPQQQRPLTWPCARCHVQVPIDDDECPNCHAKFLTPELPNTERGLLERLPATGQRKASTAFLVMVVGGLVLTGVFVGLLALLSTVF